MHYVLLLIQTIWHTTSANTGRPTHTRGTRSGFQVLQWFHFHLICNLLSNPVLPFGTLYCSREGKEEKKKQAEENEEEEKERSESGNGDYLRYINCVLTW